MEIYATEILMRAARAAYKPTVKLLLGKILGPAHCLKTSLIPASQPMDLVMPLLPNPMPVPRASTPAIPYQAGKFLELLSNGETPLIGMIPPISSLSLSSQHLMTASAAPVLIFNDSYPEHPRTTRPTKLRISFLIPSLPVKKGNVSS